MDESKITINWYPGHMAKAKRMLADQLQRVDVIIELCDARLPKSSRNPDLLRMGRNKPRVVLLGKADLADPVQTDKWIRRFKEEGAMACMALDTRVKAKAMLPLIENAAQRAVDKAADRGIRKTVRCMVVGVPNVGKSTFINRLHGSSITKTGDKPGVTRSTQWVKISPYLELLDSPGLLWPRLDDKLAARRLAYISAIKDDVLDTAELAMQLLEDMMVAAPASTKERFKIKDETARGVELLDEVCRGRGFLMKGGVYDYDRCCAVVLDEYRAGKLGRITLEHCENVKKPEEKKPQESDKQENETLVLPEEEGTDHAKDETAEA